MQEPTRLESWEGRSGWNRTSEQVPSDLSGYWRRHVGKVDHAQDGTKIQAQASGKTFRREKTLLEHVERARP